MSRTALVTGSAGFIGRHVVRALVDHGWNVTGVDIKHGIDCRTAFALDRRFDLVVHCAAHVGGRDTIDNRPLSQVVNFELDAAFFRYVSLTKPWRAVYYSSSAAYPIAWQNGIPWQAPRIDQSPTIDLDMHLRENMIDLTRPALPDALYGRIKLNGEYLATLVNAHHDNVHVLRPFSGYGADQDTTYPFPALIERVQRGDDPIEVWGSGEQVRDWIHVDDLVGATLAVLEHLPSSIGSLNVCTGIGTSFIELIKMMQLENGRVCLESWDVRGAIRPVPDRPTGVMHRVGDPTNMLKIYVPQVTLAEGIRRALT